MGCIGLSEGHECTKGLVLKHKHAAVVRAQIIDLLVPHHTPKFLAHKFDAVQSVRQARLVTQEYLGQIGTHMPAQRLHASSGHIRLI